MILERREEADMRWGRAAFEVTKSVEVIRRSALIDVVMVIGKVYGTAGDEVQSKRYNDGLLQATMRGQVITFRHNRAEKEATRTT